MTRLEKVQVGLSCTATMTGSGMMNWKNHKYEPGVKLHSRGGSDRSCREGAHRLSAGTHLPRPVLVCDFHAYQDAKIMINKDKFAQAPRFQSVSVPSVQLSEFIPVPFCCTHSGWNSTQGNRNILQRARVGLCFPPAI